ncbi:nucleolar 58 isoform X3, partial [Paramuricea clavata]
MQSISKRLTTVLHDTLKKLSGTGKSVAKAEKYEMKDEVKGYNPATDSTLPTSSKKRKHEETVYTEETNGQPEGGINSQEL